MPILDLSIYQPGAGDGLPGPNTLPYSGLTVPAGTDAVLEYNGLFLNIQKNRDRYKIKDIDGLFDADVRDARQPNTEEDGETLQAAFMGGRTLVLNGTIKTYSLGKLRAMQQALRTAFSDLSQEYPLHFRTGDFSKDHFIMCKKFASSSGAEQQQDASWTRDFQITLRASNPRFLSFYQNSLYAYPNPSTAMTPLFTAINRGNYWAQTTIRIWAPFTSVTLLNDATGATFTLSGVTYAQQYVEWNNATRAFQDALGDPVWGILGDDADKVLLQGTGFPMSTTATNSTGENNIFYAGDAPRVDISWYDSWV